MQRSPTGDIAGYPGGLRAFPGANMVMTFSPVVHRKGPAKVAPKPVLRASPPTNSRPSRPPSGSENVPPEGNAAPGAPAAKSVLRAPNEVMEQLHSMHNEVNQAREWLRKVSGGEVGTDGPYFSPCRAKGASQEALKNHPLFKELVGEDTSDYQSLFTMRTTCKGQNEAAQLRAQMMKFRQAVQELIKKREGVAEYACGMDAEFAKREKAYKDQVSTFSKQLRTLQATAESHKSAAQGTSMTLQEVAAERDELRSQLSDATERAEEAEKKADTESRVKLEEAQGLLKSREEDLSASHKVAEQRKREIEVLQAELEAAIVSGDSARSNHLGLAAEKATLEEDKILLIASQEVIKEEKLELATSNAAALKEVCELKDKVFRMKEQNTSLTRQVEDVRKECHDTVEKLKAELMEEAFALEQKDQEMNAEKALLEAEVARVKEQCQALEARASDAAKSKADAEALVESSSKRMREAEAQVVEMTAEVAETERQAKQQVKDVQQYADEQLEEAGRLSEEQMEEMKKVEAEQLEELKKQMEEMKEEAAATLEQAQREASERLEEAGKAARAEREAAAKDAREQLEAVGAEASGRVKCLSDRVEGLGTEVEDARGQLKGLEGSIGERDRCIKALEGSVEAKKSEIEALEQQVAESTQDASLKQERVAALEEEVGKLAIAAESQKQEAEDREQTLESALNDAESRIASLVSEVTDKECTVSSLESERGGLEGRIKGLEGDLKGKEARVCELEEQREGLTTNLESLEGVREALETKLADSETSAKGLTDMVDKLESEVASSKEACCLLEEMLKEAREQGKAASDGLEEAQVCIASQQAALDTAEEERNQTREALEAEQEARGSADGRLTFRLVSVKALAEERKCEGDALRREIAAIAQAKEEFACEMQSQISASEGDKEALQAKVSAYESELEEARQAQMRWSADRDALEANVAAKSAHNDKLAMQIEEAAKTLSGTKIEAEKVVKRLEASFKGERDAKLACEVRVAALEAELGSLKDHTIKTNEDLSNTKAGLDAAEASLATARSQVASLTAKEEQKSAELVEAKTEVAVGKAHLEEKTVGIKMAQEERDTARGELSKAVAERELARGQVEELRERCSDKDSQMSDVKAMLKSKEEELERVRDGLQQDLLRSRDEAKQTKYELDRIKMQECEKTLEASQERVEAYGVEVEAHKADLVSLEAKYDEEHKAKVCAIESLAVLEAEYHTYKTVANDTPAQLAEKLEKLVTLEAEKASARSKMASAEEDLSTERQCVAQLKEEGTNLRRKLLASENARRKLHNELQEIKGNVRVFVRVRPEGNDGERTVVEVDEDLGTVGVPCRGEFHPFNFDRTFSPRATQDDMFAEVSAYVQSALDGFNVSLFAYGQTGSGKTHTMFGSPSDQGLIPRAIDQILTTVDQESANGWSYEMQASFLEIYNEQVRDLLCSASDEEGRKHQITQGENGRNDVTDVVMVPVEAHEDVQNIMAVAQGNRSTAKTDMNEHSSRSHTVFSLRITATRSTVGQTQTLHGTLHLIDLAGSERLARSHATGDRLKETQSINKSLSALSDVFQAISKKQAHIPYRNSKLTHLLQPCLSGDGKALVICNLSPVEDSASETLCTLRFAHLVGSCELGKATKHVATTGNGSSWANASVNSSLNASHSEDPPVTPRQPTAPAPKAAKPNASTTNSRKSMAPSAAATKPSGAGMSARAAARQARQSVMQTPSKASEDVPGGGRVFGMMTPGGTLAPHQ